MKKNSSKSILHKKNKTFSTIPESKKNSRIVKANSCIKINSLNSQQASKVTMNNNNPSFSKQHLSQVSNKRIVNYPISQTQNLIDKPLQLRNSVRQYIKSSFEAGRMDNNKDATGDLRSKQKNQDLIKENTLLRQKCCELQEISLRDKQKIKNLIVRIGEVKQANTQFSAAKSMHPSTAKLTTLNNLDINQNSASQLALPIRLRLQTPFKGLVQVACQNKECQQRKKYLQSELYRQRIMRDKLQLQKRQWQKNRQELKNQYNQLLYQIQGMRDNQY